MRYMLQVGDTVTFGHYEQDNQLSNDAEEIEWIVLEIQNGKGLLLSKYLLDVKSYNTYQGVVTWETCTLRSWLNKEFLNSAFTAEEQTAILTSTVDNSKNQGYSGYSTDGGNNTQDKVFLLSYAEAWRYFTSDSARATKPTDYAVAQGAYQSISNGNCWWWLRSPGSNQNVAAYVGTDGSRDSSYVSDGSNAIRPAFWLNLESDIF